LVLPLSFNKSFLFELNVKNLIDQVSRGLSLLIMLPILNGAPKVYFMSARVRVNIILSDCPHERSSLKYHFIVWDHILDLPFMPWDDEVLLLK
jgi:hypothetical protein